MALAAFNKFLVGIFGSRNERIVKSYMQMAQAAGKLESHIQTLTDEQLKAKTDEFKQALRDGRRPQDILPEAFAVVREAARRHIAMRHFDVQLVGGNVLYDGKIAEMATGEGKTLVATLAAYLVHLTGRKVHIVTVNDYLAKRDAEWMGPAYRALGLSVGAIQAEMDTSGDERKQQYACDITYGTNNEFGFDYLRDNMKISLSQMAQGPLEYAIIDEVDSILIDEARTPLIISGPAVDDVSRYKKADSVARQLISLQAAYNNLKKAIETAERTLANAQGELSEAKKAKDPERISRAQKVIEQTQAQMEADKARLETMTQYYEVEEDRKAVHLTHEGIGAAQEIAGVGSFFTGSNMEWPHMLEQALRAHVAFEKEKDYVVMDGKVIIVDEFTGRLMHGRQWSDGLHQAVEAKENVQIKEETQTLATITLQNFFKLYQQIAGMTGTAATEAEEFMKIYHLEVVTIPTNRPCIRDDRDDLIYKTLREKFNAIVDEIHETSAAGRPVLVGTVSIEKSEALSEALTRRYGIEHEVLNAKQHAREAVIVEKAGQQHTTRTGEIRGNVTIATNMAGRGTDIKLGPGVAKIGGLHIVGTERHEARRIDNQLRGRAGRQGDPGSSVFFLSFDDDLMRIFAPEATVKLLSLIGWEEGMPIQHKRISKGIEKAQKKVEERNFEARKSLLEYDEVMDIQRRYFYGSRRKIIEGRDLKQTIWQMVEDMIDGACRNILASDYPSRCIAEWAHREFGVELDSKRLFNLEVEQIEEMIKELARKNVANDISMALGEYLEDYEDPQTWKIDALCKWAMSSFHVSLSAAKLRQMTADAIEQALIEAACEQVNRKSTAGLAEFLNEDYSIRTFSQWAASKFDIHLDLHELKTLGPDAVRQKLTDSVREKYTRREIEYPVEFAMSMVFGPQGPNVYAFESLAKWAQAKYESTLTAEQLQKMPPQEIYQHLLELSRSWNDGKLLSAVENKLSTESPESLAAWAKERFGAKLDVQQLRQSGQAKDALLAAGREFLRKELTDLERYVLLQIYDVAWKDHLYAMDHLKESIMLRAYAEKDPKIEYKQEGHRMFNEMLETIEDRVTDIIFRVRLEAGQRARSVYNVSRAQHNQVSQFEMAQRQRAAAQAPQGEQKVKQIKLEGPKVGRNDPCPCGSGKKYKKCCGKNTP
ncbi:MAG TPA: preprotein translocase subunit SecA [Anaerohalosphaeraceae bacterium]|nr:preprotein translocase subunit SecA [Anaerohalosphaeraceae bacterium]HOL32097.1 preprotein translocase subunit SecA [Anaerohalosphaeraceae bacterium]HPC64189.1 preprotein translocase subunit SecA [Anaerohalosphaeraceae bacterium]HPO68843.1 preprotein translocase subunit SecA [Anaerohalosphaeraceae bacterium]HRS70941.1 preprotein translocase subunit SecA [Anaerohalosphaeraceae bacterium]